jgi:hypothetical protein
VKGERCNGRKEERTIERKDGGKEGRRYDIKEERKNDRKEERTIERKDERTT